MHGINTWFHMSDGAQQASPKCTISTFKSLHDSWPSDVRLPTVIVNCSLIPGGRMRPATPIEDSKDHLELAIPVPTPWLGSPTEDVYLVLA